MSRNKLLVVLALTAIIGTFVGDQCNADSSGWGQEDVRPEFRLRDSARFSVSDYSDIAQLARIAPDEHSQDMPRVVREDYALGKQLDTNTPAQPQEDRKPTVSRITDIIDQVTQTANPKK